MGKPRNTRHTRKYPKYPEIPERKKDTRKYPIVFFDTPTRPEPDPLPGIFANTRPDPTRYWKTLPAGHWSSHFHKCDMPNCAPQIPYLASHIFDMSYNTDLRCWFLASMTAVAAWTSSESPTTWDRWSWGRSGTMSLQTGRTSCRLHCLWISNNHYFYVTEIIGIITSGFSCKRRIFRGKKSYI